MVTARDVTSMRACTGLRHPSGLNASVIVVTARGFHPPVFLLFLVVLCTGHIHDNDDNDDGDAVRCTIHYSPFTI